MTTKRKFQNEFTLNMKKWLFSALSGNSAFFWSMLTLYFITFVILLPWMCNSCAHSIYMSSSWSNEDLSHIVMEKNKERLEIAKNQISRLDLAQTLIEHKELLNSDSVDVIIAVISVKRVVGSHEVGYLTQVMARFDEIIRKEKKSDYFTKKGLFICNTHAGPGKHEEAERLAEYFPMVTRFPEEDPAHVILERFEKEKQDYAYCLQETLKYSPKYILMVEDDAVPRYDLFQILAYSLQHYMENKWQAGEIKQNTEPWAYFKLFYPEKWQGYSSHFKPMSELFAMGMIGGSISAFVSYFCFIRGQYRTKYHAYNKNTRCAAFIMGAVYVMLLCWSVGRQYISELHRLSPVLYNIGPAPDCCSPAILYPGHIVPGLVDYLNNVLSKPDFGIDIAIEEFVQRNDFKKYLIEPNLFKHIGYISTIKGPASNPALYLY